MSSLPPTPTPAGKTSRPHAASHAPPTEAVKRQAQEAPALEHPSIAAPTNTQRVPAVPEQTPTHGLSQTILLALIGLACVGAAIGLAYLMGDFRQMGQFLEDPTEWASTVSLAGYPSAPSYLGLLLAWPGGKIIAWALVICMGMGLMSLRAGRRLPIALPAKVLSMTAAGLLPLLTVDFMIASNFEFVSTHAMPTVLLNDPVRLGAWVSVFLTCALIICFVADVLVIRWAWRREDRLRLAYLDAAGT